MWLNPRPLEANSSWFWGGTNEYLFANFQLTLLISFQVSDRTAGSLIFDLLLGEKEGSFFNIPGCKTNNESELVSRNTLPGKSTVGTTNCVYQSHFPPTQGRNREFFCRVHRELLRNSHEEFREMLRCLCGFCGIEICLNLI